MRKNRLISGGAPGKLFSLRTNIKYFLIFVYILAVGANAAGVYPVLVAGHFAAVLIYAVFFAFLYFIEKIYSRGKICRRTEERFYYLIFIVFVTLTGITGNIASPIKWSVYTLIFVIIMKRYYFQATVTLIFYFLVFLKDIPAFAVHDYYSFLSLSALLVVVYFTGKKRGASQEEGGDKTERIETGAEEKGRNFRVIAYDLLSRLLGHYRVLMGAGSVVFFMRDPENENRFDLFACSADECNIIDEDYSINVKEGVLGAAVKKNDFFAFDTGGMKMPYYKSAEENSGFAATRPLVTSRIIGVIAADFKEGGDDTRKKAAEQTAELSREILDILRLFEINRKVLGREKQVTRLYDIYGRLNMLEGKAELMNAFFESIKGFDISGGFLAEYAPGSRVFEITEVFNYPENIKGAKFGAREDEAVKKVYNTGKKVILRDTSLKNMRLNFQKGDVDKFMLSPLKKGGKIYGLIKLDKEKEFDFSGFELKTLDIILARITALLENAGLYEKIKEQATRDGLTGLYNHLTFQKMLRESMEKRDRGDIQFVSLFVMDIDFFKKFNDSFGHQEGDNVLKKLAGALKDFALRHPGTYAARYGGEEFVFVLEDYDIYRASRAAEEIRKFSESNLRGGNEREKRKITLSIGVTTYPDYARSPREMIKNADEALYMAKEQGRNRVKSVIDIRNR